MIFEGKQNSICKQILQKMLFILQKLTILKKKYFIHYDPDITVYYIHLIFEIVFYGKALNTAQA